MRAEKTIGSTEESEDMVEHNALFILLKLALSDTAHTALNVLTCSRVMTWVERCDPFNGWQFSRFWADG